MSSNSRLGRLQLNKVHRVNVDLLADVPAHPIAAMYPMLAKDRLDAMVESIRTVGGQIHPVILRRLKGGHEILDGRNRLEACRIAGSQVKIKIVELDDEKSTGLIDSVNNQRREMNYRERALLAWKLIEESKNGPGKRLTTETAAAMVGIGLRTLQKWKPGGEAGKASERKRRYRMNSQDRRFKSLSIRLGVLLSFCDGEFPEFDTEVNQIAESIDDLHTRRFFPHKIGK